MAVLEFLARPAPARLVATELLALVDVARLHVDRGDGLLALVAVRGGLGDLARDDAGSGSGERARLGGALPARVAEPACRARVGGRLPRRRPGRLRSGALVDLDLDAEDVTPELLPD